jgi:hypothetical protein
MNKIDWNKEVDPRKYCFGHKLYRRLVSTVSSYRLRVESDPSKLEEVDKTMELLNDSMFAGKGGRVEVFEFALNEEVIVAQEDVEVVRCRIQGQLIMNVDDPVHEVLECYLTDKHGIVWVSADDIAPILDEKDEIVKDDRDETDTSKV